MELTINAARLEKRIEELSQIGKISETGVCRLALSPEDKQAVELVKTWFEDAGMNTRIDAFGNLIGRIEGQNCDLPILMLGSHIDTQPYAGRFDGTIGVLGALEVVQTLKELGIKPLMPLEVISFCDEEGCRFNKGLFGVRGILNRLEPDELERKDKQGITRRRALLDYGCDLTQFESSTYDKSKIGAYLEMHIEQGPVLESLSSPLGVVTGISGPLWLTVEMSGFAGHAGSVPMHLRQDALLGAAKAIVALNEIATSIEGAPTVGTVGSLTVFPDSRNIIPEKVIFTIDLRDIDLSRRLSLEKLLFKRLEEISATHKLKLSMTEDTNSEPRYCASQIMQSIHHAAHTMNMQLPELMSGPFHDALEMSYVCDYGMIFVRCKDGISHNPKEFANMEDIALGTELLYRTVLSMLDKPLKG